MSTDVTFTEAKDPEETGWWEIPLSGQVTSVIACTVAESMPTDFGLMGQWSTPGDTLPASDLSVLDFHLSDDGKSVWVYLSGGRPQKSYAVRMALTGLNGDRYFRSVILPVTGR